MTPPRVHNTKIPKAINDIVMRALAPDLTVRYQRASELLDAVLAIRQPVRRAGRVSGSAAAATVTPPGATIDQHVADIQSRLRARETPQPSFCWHCRKPLQARTARCPFCNENQ